MNGPCYHYVDEVVRRLELRTWLGRLASVCIFVVAYVPLKAVIQYVAGGGWELLTEDNIWTAVITGVLLTAVMTIWPGTFTPGRTRDE